MKSFLTYFSIALVFILIGWFGHVAWTLPKAQNPVAEIKTYPLEKYTIENLASKYSGVAPSQIEIGKILKDDPKYTSYEFTYAFDPTLSNGPKKTVSGLINIPKGAGPFPLIVMIRGFVDQTKYVIGTGTARAAEIFATNGYITIAPDFLGYGDSDKESPDIFESRFQTYTTTLTLLKSLQSVQNWNGKAYIWAHSNGGQIALTALEVSGVNYPTVLWAPNSAKFPYSIIYYLDEAPDQGKLVVTKLAEFMADYDVTKYAFGNFESMIRAPILLDQGTADDSVPMLWSDTLNKNLKKLNIDITYTKYPGADHNMQPTWNTTVQDNLLFFQKHI